ncbi:MAG: nucleotidyltransferase domain-containing protein [Myxococcota bacterium]|nr:nucleotidyltransferase domain-containing protein [Myxococcota bacterium]
MPASVGEFVRLVRASPEGGGLAKVVLFGSVVRGTDGPDSDVDVLVVGVDPGRLSMAVADAAFEIQMRACVPIEPVVVALDEILPPTSYFVERVLRTGVEVFTSEASRALAPHAPRPAPPHRPRNGT